jgi:hypothetical protein
MQSTLDTVSDDIDTIQQIEHQLSVHAEELTVGYGERFPVSDHDWLVTDNDANRMERFSHAHQERAIAYDLTSFFPPNGNPIDGQAAFVELLRTVGVDPYDDYVRVFVDMGRGKPFDYDDHVWGNSDLLIQTNVNPITGRKNGEVDDHEWHRLGFASYCGVGGREDEVREAALMIKEYNPKDTRYDGLFF